MGTLLRASVFALLAITAACGAIHDPYVSIGSIAGQAGAEGATRFVLKSGVGTVRVEPGAADAVRVTAEVYVRESHHADFEAVASARDLRVERVDDVVYVENLHLRDAGEGNGAGGSIWRIDLVVQAPPALAWEIAHAVGGVTITAAGGDVKALVAVGELTLRGSAAHLELESSTGNVDAELSALRGGALRSGVGDLELRLEGGGIGEPLALTTGTGSIALVLPAAIDADLTLGAGVGDVRVTAGPGGAAIALVPGATNTGPVGASRTARVGKGGAAIKATTGVGSIRVVVGG